MQNCDRFDGFFQERIAEIYDAERQLLQIMPKWIAQASSEALRGAIQLHLDETAEHVIRLEAIFDRIGVPGGKRCDGMQALLIEGAKALGRWKDQPVLDIAILTVARQIGHFEIASYASVCTIAESLARPGVLALLRETIAEEKRSEAGLAEVAAGILRGDDLPEGALADGGDDDAPEDLAGY